MAPRVLLVGEIGKRLEVEFIGAGLDCTVVPTALAAVGAMRQSALPVVVVPSQVPDMPAQAFARGLLEHFPNVIVLMYGAPLDEFLEKFVKDGRVVPVPEQTKIAQVADYLRRRVATLGGASSSPAPSSATSSPVPSMASGGRIPTVERGLPELTPQLSSQLTANHLGPAPPSNVAPSTALNPKPTTGTLPRAKTVAPVPVVMLESDDDAEEKAKATAQQIVDLQARVAAADWALGKEKQARADVDRMLFETKEQLKAAQQALQAAATTGASNQGAVKAAQDAIARERDAAQTARDNAVRERDAIAAGRDAIATEREAIAAERDKVVVERDEAQKQAYQTQRDLDEARTALRALESEVSDLRKRLGASSGHASMLQAQLDDERIAHGKARGDLDKATAELGALRIELDDTRNERSSLGNQLDAERRGRAADNDAHRAAVAALDVKVANHAEALRRVAVDLKLQQDATKAAVADADAAKARIKELEESLSQAKASQAAMAEGNKLTDHDKRKLEARIGEMSRELEDHKRKAEESRDEMFKARQLRDDAELHSADLEIQIVDLKSALESVKSELKQTIETGKSELETARQKIAELSAQIEEMRTSGGRNNAELQRLESKLDVVTQERDRALSALTDASRKLMALEDERQAS